MNKIIVCIGAGYIGGPTMAVIAQENPDRPRQHTVGFTVFNIGK